MHEMTEPQVDSTPHLLRSCSHQAHSCALGEDGHPPSASQDSVESGNNHHVIRVQGRSFTVGLKTGAASQPPGGLAKTQSPRFASRTSDSGGLGCSQESASLANSW